MRRRKRVIYAWGIHGKIAFKAPTSPVEALNQAGILMRTFAIGSSCKVNEGEYLKPSFGKLMVHQRYLVEDYGTGKKDKAWLASQPSAFDDWHTNLTQLAVENDLDAAAIWSVLSVQYGQIDLKMRAGRHPPTEYVLEYLEGTEWSTVPYGLLVGMKRAGKHHTPGQDGPRAESRICEFFAKGHCSRGNRCAYAHEKTPRTRFERDSNDRGRSRSRERVPATPHPKSGGILKRDMRSRSRENSKGLSTSRERSNSKKEE